MWRLLAVVEVGFEFELWYFLQLESIPIFKVIYSINRRKLCFHITISISIVNKKLEY